MHLIGVRNSTSCSPHFKESVRFWFERRHHRKTFIRQSPVYHTMVHTVLHLVLIIAVVLFTALASACPNGTHPMENGPPFICVPGPKGCPPGMITSRTMFLPGSYVTECRKCQSGYTTYSYSARMCRRIGYPCPMGHFETKNGDCWRCFSDEFFDLKKQRCVSCATGTGSVGGHALWCAPCSRIVKHGVSYSRCARGLVFAPRRGVCPSGSRVSYRDSVGAPVCQKCRPGTFSRGSNQPKCQTCPTSSVSGHGSRQCTRCSREAIPNTDRSKCIGRESVCPLDQRRVEMFGQSFCRSPSCSSAASMYPAAALRKCGPCNNSPIKSEYLTEDGWCKSCPADSLSDGLRCIKCPRGQVRLADGGCGCRGPLALNRGVDKNGNCVRCPDGSYGEPGPSGEHVCTMCRAGSYFFEKTDVEILGCFVEVRCSSSRSLCALCPKGKVSTSPGSRTCDACPAGTMTYGDGAARCFSEGEPSSPISFTDPFGNEYRI